jgi:peroxiredoxin
VPATSEVSAFEQKSTNSVGGWPDNNLVLEHKVVLENLEPSTAYIVKIKSKDAAGNEAIFESNNPYQTKPPRLTTDITIGETSPDFSLQTVTGKNVSLSDYQGRKVMLVFWLLTCSSCRDELPYLQDFWENSQHDDLTLLTINIGEKETLIKNYVQSQKLTFPVLLDQESVVSKKYTIVHYPTIILLAPDKTVKKIREEPFKNVGEIEDFIQSAGQPN